MSISAMKQALEALDAYSWGQVDAAGAALRQAIEQAEKQEPVAFRNINTGEFCTGGFLRKDWAKWQPLYTAPREWVGLTDEDIYKVIEENIPPQLNTLFDMAKWVGGVIEAKLKEKNHG
jgi:hypothetical protein